MSKRYNIRWSESDNQELRKAVKNFNAKITRLEKKYPDMKKALPEKVEVKQMRELIGTRQDLKRELNALRRFSQRGAEEFIILDNNDNNLKITKWQKNEMTRRAGIINRKRKQRMEELSQIELTSRGEKLGYTLGQFGMGRADEVSLRPIKPFTRTMGYADLRKKYKVIQNESQSSYWTWKEEVMRNNYATALIENYSHNDIVDIVEKIRTMDFKEFFQKVMETDANWEFPYPPDEEQYLANLNALRDTWIPDSDLVN